VGTAWAQGVVEPVSRQIIAFSWWWVVAGVTFWVLIVGLYYRTFLTDIETKRVEAARQVRRQRHAKERLESIHAAMDQAIRVAQVEREVAETAALRAEAAADGPAARREAELAAIAARKAEDAAIAATTTAKTLMTDRARRILAKKGGQATTEADADAAAAREAADRAARAAAAKGAPVA
jgi:hypothetical protein